MELKILTESELRDRVCVVVGTRPGIIKMSPLIKELARRGRDHFVIHAGQHYSYNMAKILFEDLRLPEPAYVLEGVKNCKLHGEQTAAMLVGIEKALIEQKPRVVLVCADANFNLAGALAARKLRLKLGHVEAGLRSGDWRMPEEHNRIMIDHISDWLFCPTQEAVDNARKDNVAGQVLLTGNTIVDALSENIVIAREKSTVLGDLGLDAGQYVLTTVHREENVDELPNLEKIVAILTSVHDEFGLPLVYPMHPRTRVRLQGFGIMDRLEAAGVRIIEPVGYLDFLMLMDNARVVITDSGGIQEETCILKVPCVTLRENTERPETVQVGSNVVVGLDRLRAMDGLRTMLASTRDWDNPFGDGTAAAAIIDAAEQGLRG